MTPLELEPSLVETAIGEDDELSSLHGSPTAGAASLFRGPSSGMAMGVSRPPPTSSGKPVHRSLSDRYSYRAAIYNTERVEYDMI